MKTFEAFLDEQFQQIVKALGVPLRIMEKRIEPMFNPDFIRSISAKPEDDGIRLAYADWLRENGDERQADFIEAQIKIPALNYGIGVNGKFPDAPTLWANDLCAILPRLSQRLEEIPKLVRIGFRRGFVQLITTDATTWENKHAEILARHPIQEVRLTDEPQMFVIVDMNQKITLSRRVSQKLGREEMPIGVTKGVHLREDDTVYESSQEALKAWEARWPTIEFERAKIRQRPFLQPAMEVALDSFAADLVQELQRGQMVAIPQGFVVKPVE